MLFTARAHAEEDQDVPDSPLSGDTLSSEIANTRTRLETVRPDWRGRLPARGTGTLPGHHCVLQRRQSEAYLETLLEAAEVETLDAAVGKTSTVSSEE